MKRNLYFMIFMLAVCSLFAQTPAKFNYQGVARNAQGVVIANQSISLKVTIIDGTISGAAVYSEVHAATTNQLGLFTLSIGAGQVLTGEFDKIAWGTSEKFIKTEMDPTGGANYVLIGTSQLLSVPYALNAKNAENVQLKAQDNYYTGGMKFSTTYNTWLSSPVQIVVENSGKYLLNASGRAYCSGISSISMRVQNSTTKSTLGITFVGGVNLNGAQQNSGSFTKIVQLSKGDIITMEFIAMATSEWAYGGDATAGSSSISILRIAD